ncbi:hypothetical protein [Conexibacter sp. SYSU D00693]|uniref:hypothetical protein n=1 Tax=Conexibacter sp. SYSU D00693 TaxID=2812560 RepID=UPI00196AED2A|nr:hypothetical protein [Conexibacter sp. SYSU D00693]
MPSTTSSTSTLDRRGVLRGAAAVAGLGAAGALTRGAGAEAAPPDVRVPLPPTRVKLSLQVVDEGRRQRFLLTSTKPPVHVQGRTFPAEARQGPDDGSYFIFNDEDQSEKGGITVSRDVAQIAFDYPTAQGLTLNTVNAGALGAAQLHMEQMPDPAIPIEELRPEDTPTRVLLATSNAGDGALLFLYDSAGRPRITLHVDGDDVPRISILDADGEVVAQLPETAPARTQAAGRRPSLSALLGRRRARGAW